MYDPFPLPNECIVLKNQHPLREASTDRVDRDLDGSRARLRNIDNLDADP
jgi:hypothetical protein